MSHECVAQSVPGGRGAGPATATGQRSSNSTVATTRSKIASTSALAAGEIDVEQAGVRCPEPLQPGASTPRQDPLDLKDLEGGVDDRLLAERRLGRTVASRTRLPSERSSVVALLRVDGVTVRQCLESGRLRTGVRYEHRSFSTVDLVAGGTNFMETQRRHQPARSTATAPTRSTAMRWILAAVVLAANTMDLLGTARSSTSPVLPFIAISAAVPARFSGSAPLTRWPSPFC